MTTDNTKKNPTVEPANEVEISEETLEELSGGAIGPFGELIERPMPPVEPKEDQGSTVTGSW